MKDIIRIGMSTSDIAAGAEETAAALHSALAKYPAAVPLKTTGSLGVSHREPVVDVTLNGDSTLYGPVTPADVPSIVTHHFDGGPPPAEHLRISNRADRSDYPFLGRQSKVTTALSGIIDPYSLDDYLAHGGYNAFSKALTMTPRQVVEMIKTSKLRGRGGAGFPTGIKWDIANRALGDSKYLICNADEGDPGAFMDRSMIEGDPHRMLEGMLIGAYAIGASKGYIYVRAEYPLAVKILHNAIDQLRQQGILGPNTLGRGKSFDFVVKEGAGAFVCGEETALMHSIEGKRGTPRMRPPYPAEHGLWGDPSNINNVETLCSIRSIVQHGADWFAQLGTPQSGGTKTFALVGAVQRSGLVEVPIGMSLREVIYDLGGGPPAGRTLKAVQLGGPSGGCIPANLLNTRIDYDDLKATGAIMGSGGMIVLDDTTSMVEMARYFLAFTQEESCGKCVPCRVGTRKMLNMLDHILSGNAHAAELDKLRSLCHTVGTTSLCGLGQTAPNPALTTLRYFEEEYNALVN